MHLDEVAPDDGGILLLLGGTYGERQYDVNKKRMTIGRDPALQILVDADGVSRHHARIINTEGAVSVEDLGSTNGTLPNGARLTEPTKLSEDDLNQAGQEQAQRSQPRGPSKHRSEHGEGVLRRKPNSCAVLA